MVILEISYIYSISLPGASKFSFDAFRFYNLLLFWDTYYGFPSIVDGYNLFPYWEGISQLFDGLHIPLMAHNEQWSYFHIRITLWIKVFMTLPSGLRLYKGQIIQPKQLRYFSPNNFWKAQKGKRTWRK